MVAFFRCQLPSHWVSILFLLFPRVCSISFQINDFDSDANMVYYGDAQPLNGSITFDEVSHRNQAGWASYAEKVLLWDPVSGEISDFRTHFSFVIDNLGNSTYGHGLAFFLAPVGIHMPLNSSGGFLGLFNTTKKESFHTQIVHVEFDTFPDPEWDPPFQHAGINKRSIASAVYTPWNASLHNGEKTNVWISYNATAKNLSVTWTYQTASETSEKYSLFYQIDLMKVLPEWVTIGFSASVGNYVEKHTIEFWEFNSSLDVNEEYDINDESEGAINIRLEALLIAWVTLLIIALITAFLISLRQSGKEKIHAVKLASIYTDLNEGAGPRRFSYRYLALATDNFSIHRKLGEGGFGTVYKGNLPGANKTVAVKKISKRSNQGEKEYASEVKIISRMRHQNLVQLIGWCHDGGRFLLAYEFMPNGSLDSHLSGKRPPLPWQLRYKISLGLASALLYLHEQSERCVVHRDIKSSNVLLDSDFNAKLGDFGLARHLDKEISSKATGLAGTFGYMAPEYISTGWASKESDIFSYGVVLLEIVTGRKSTDTMERDSGKGLIESVWDLYGREQLLEALDEKVRNDFDPRQVECLNVVGLWCAHPDPTRRPSIQEAIHVLNFEETMPNLPAKMPVPTFNASSLKFSKLNDVYQEANLDVTCLIP